MMRNAIIIATAALAVGACAPRASSIQPVSMPGGMYDHLGCAETANEVSRLSASVAELERQQNKAATGDAFSVFLIGVPVGSLTGGDKAGQLATEKGKLEVAKARLMRCGRE